MAKTTKQNKQEQLEISNLSLTQTKKKVKSGGKLYNPTNPFRTLKTSSFIDAYIMKTLIFDGFQKLLADEKLYSLIKSFNKIERLTPTELLDVIYRSTKLTEAVSSNSTAEVLINFYLALGTEGLYEEENEYLSFFEDAPAFTRSFNPNIHNDILKIRESIVFSIKLLLLSSDIQMTLANEYTMYSCSAKDEQSYEIFMSSIKSILKPYLSLLKIPSEEEWINRETNSRYIAIFSRGNSKKKIDKPVLYIHPEDNIEDVKKYIISCFTTFPDMNAVSRYADNTLLNSDYITNNLQVLMENSDSILDIVNDKPGNQIPIPNRAGVLLFLEKMRRISGAHSIQDLVSRYANLGKPMVNESRIVIGGIHNEVTVIYNLHSNSFPQSNILKIPVESLQRVLDLTDITINRQGVLCSDKTRIWDLIVGANYKPADGNYNNLMQYNY